MLTRIPLFTCGQCEPTIDYDSLNMMKKQSNAQLGTLVRYRIFNRLRLGFVNVKNVKSNNTI